MWPVQLAGSSSKLDLEANPAQGSQVCHLAMGVGAAPWASDLQEAEIMNTGSV